MNDGSAPKGAPEPAATLADPTIPPGTAQLALAAIDYARRGWPVFPCRPGGKAPALRGHHGHKDATTDLGRITYWWRHQPDANIGIATGAPGPDVLDVDVKREGSGWAAFDGLKRAGLLTGATDLVSTRNGGAHVYFTGTRQPCGSVKPMFIDFKACGGYVLAPPSAVPADDWAPDGTGRYALVWSRQSDATLDWASCKALLTPPRHTAAHGPRHVATPEDLPGWLCDRLAVADPADRSAHFHGIVGGCAFAGLDLAQTIAVLQTWPAAVDKYGPRLSAEVERSWSKIGGRPNLAQVST